MIRILWISAFTFTSKDELGSGVWQKSLFTELTTCEDIILGNIGPSSSGEIETSTFLDCQQWSLPKKKCTKGLPSQVIIKEYESIIEEYKPDVVHVWGSENFLKLLPFDVRFKYKKLMVMQGVLSSMSKFMFSGLSFRESLRTYGIRELIRGGSLMWEEKSFKEEGELEKTMLNNSDHVLVQSNWTSLQVKWLNQDVPQTFVTRQLRTEFLEVSQWQEKTGNDPVIFASAVGYSFKGLHILIKALALLKEIYPKIKLHLASKEPSFGLRGSGYFNYINRLIQKYKLSDNIVWTGRLNAKEIIVQLQQANVFVQPSFVESYSVAFAESMSVGTPCVISYAGAMPELAKPNEEALYFQAGDYAVCAKQIVDLISNQSFSKELSDNSRRRSKNRIENVNLKEIHQKLYHQLMEN
jgi:glycosyltransferase involved in cell wall biosynthesis